MRALSARVTPWGGPLAQLAEQQALNLRVVGSIPTRLTNSKPNQTSSRGGRRCQLSATKQALLSLAFDPQVPRLGVSAGMHIHVSARRDFQALRQRRRQAARLFAGGQLILAAIARRLNVSRPSVTRWYREWRQRGAAGLRGAGRAGWKPRLDRQQRRRLDRALRRGPRAYGFETDLWTVPRVASVIEQLTGVRYHPGHVWKLLGAMDWTLQRPARQARERNAEAVQDRVDHRWPAVK